MSLGGTILVGLVVSQLYDSCGGLARWLIAKAAGRLREAPRFEEEWLAHLTECHGKLGMLLHGLGCVKASLYMQPGRLKVVTDAKTFGALLGLEMLGFVALRLLGWRLNRKAKIASERQNADEVILRAEFEEYIDNVAKVFVIQIARKQIAKNMFLVLRGKKISPSDEDDVSA